MSDERIVTPIDMGLAKAFLLRGAKPILVDTGYRRAASRLMKGLSAHGVTPKDLSLILITHGHDDHFGNIAYLKERTGTPVAIHKRDADALRTGMAMPSNPNGAIGAIMKLILPPNRRPRFAGFEPDVVIEDELDLNPFGVRGRVISTPGHTPGSISVILDSGEAIISDLLSGSLLTATVPVIAFWAWNEKQSRESIRKVLALKPRVIYATHGGPFDPSQVARKFLPDG